MEQYFGECVECWMTIAYNINTQSVGVQCGNTTACGGWMNTEMRRDLKGEEKN